MYKIISKSYKYLKKYKYKLFIYYLLTLTMSSISIIYPQIIGEFTDVLIGKDIEALYRYILCFIIFNLINLTFTYISGKLYIYIQAQSSYQFNKDVNIHVWNIPLLKSAQYDSAYLADRINSDTNSIIIYSINVIQTILSTIISIIVSSVFMMKVDKIIYKKRFDEMSGGEKRKVQIYSEIFKQSEILILDEPANDLDKESIENLKNLILDIHENKIIVIVDHDNNFDDIIDELIYV